MIIATQPISFPTETLSFKPELSITRPLDPELSNASFSVHQSIENTFIRVKDTTYSISMIKDWADRPAMPTTEISYSEKKELAIEPLIQQGNTCGPTSLTMVLKGLGIKASTEEVIERTHCSTFIGTSPIDIRETAQSFGLHASIVNDASPQAVINILSSNGRCIAVIEQSGSLHYVAINGYRKDRSGNVEFLICDPNGFSQYKSTALFDEEWRSPKLKGFDIGLDRCMIVLSEKPIVEERFSGKGLLFAELHSFANHLTSFLLPGLLLSAIQLGKKLKLKKKPISSQESEHKKSAPFRGRFLAITKQFFINLCKD